MKKVLLILLLMSFSTCWSQTTTPAKPDTGKKIFKYVEQMPQFPGGAAALVNYIHKYLHYPTEATQSEISGTVFVNFVVNKDGTISDIKLQKGIGSGCDEAVINMVKTMPHWIPGRQNGNAVNVLYNLPVKFKPGSE